MLLNLSFPLAVHLSYLGCLLLCHRNHLKGLFILGLPPLAKGSATVALPVHSAYEVDLAVLGPGQVLVSSKLSDVLESSLPEGP